MKRSKRGIDPIAWLVGLGVPAMLLIGVFSTMPYARMAGTWPFRIGGEEVRTFQRWFDLRRSTIDTSSHAEHFRFSPDLDLSDGRWHRALFTVDGRSDSVSIRALRTVEGGMVVRLPKERPFRSQHQFVLIPASASSMRSKYEEVLATELGVSGPEVTFVDVAFPTRHGIYLKEERISEDFLEKHRMNGGTLFHIGFSDRPDHLFPEVDDPALSSAVSASLKRMQDHGQPPFAPQRDAMIGHLLLLATADRSDLWLDEGPFVHDWTTGTFVPLYRARRYDPSRAASMPQGPHIFQRVLSDPSFIAALQDRQDGLKEDLWRLKERFAALDLAWLPVLAAGCDLSLVQAEADRVKEDLFARIRDLDVPGHFAAMPPAPMPPPFADFGAATMIEAPPRTVLAERLQGEWIGDSLVLHRGRRVITEDLVLPVGVALVLEKSVRLELAPGRSVLVQGPLIARGTGVNPVFIRPLREDSAFGSFAVAMNGGRCELRGLLISGGSEARLNGQHHSGMLSVHGASSVIIERCAIGGSHGEDALNVVRGNVLVRDCVFEDAHADLVDLDFVKGAVTGCTFRNRDANANGDGLDVSGSRVHVTGCRFIGMKDKGLSAGEVSEVLVEGSAFEGNALGVASKDLSIVHLQACDFTGNGIAIAAYRKKPIHGGARIQLYGSTFTANATDRQVDSLSAVINKEALDGRVRTLFGLSR